jgi:membrane-associated protein
VLHALQDPDAVLAAGAWAYVVLALAVCLDSVVPVLPSELLCVAAGTFVASGRLNGWLVVPAVILGGVLGDQATYHLGRAGSRRVARTMTSTHRRRRFFERLGRALARRRTSTIVAARFLPGGRTGIGLLAGVTSQPRRAYLAASALGVSMWTAYVVGTGYVAGRAAGGVWVSVGLAVAAMGLVSVGATLASRRRRHPVLSFDSGPIGPDRKDSSVLSRPGWAG